MGSDSMEEGLQPTRPLLLDTNTSAVNGQSNSSAGDSSITPILVLSTFVAVCASFCNGFAMGYTSPAESGIMQDLGLSVAAYSLFGSIITIGAMVGAIFSGKVADFLGRRRAMWLCEFFCAPGWLAIAFAKDAWWLDIGRLSIGFGSGITTYAVPVYIAEITPKNIRGRFISANQLMATFGFGTAYFMGNIVSWRTLSLIADIPCIVQVIGLFFIPESPRWLAKRGREKEFESALRCLRGQNADISQEALDIKETVEMFQSDQESGTFKLLFQRRYAYPIIVGVGLMLLQQLGGNSGLVSYASSIIADANFPVAIATTTISILQVVATTVSLLLMDACGRRKLLLISSAGTCLFLPLLALSFYLQDIHLLKGVTPILAFLGILGYLTSYCVGLLGIPFVIMSEIFPINIKATAGSLVTLINCSCSWLVTFSFNFMIEWSSTGTFVIFTVMCGLTLLFIWKLVPETKGRSLEEIQTTITHLPYQDRSNL